MIFAILTAPLLLATPEATTGPPGEEVVVTAYAKPYKLNGKRLATAQRVFAKHRARTSPQARLLFQARPRGQRDLSGLRLTLRSAGQSIPVALDGENRFALPSIPKGDWRLVANRGSAAMEITPIVLSPGSTPDDRRLGDLRLECEVVWAAFFTPEMPLWARAATAATPPCRSSRLPLYTEADQVIASAFVASGNQITPIQVRKNGRSWRYPGYDKRLPNDARVRFRYE